MQGESERTRTRMSEAILHQWLESQCTRIPGVRSGLLHFITSAGKRSIVQWPEKNPHLVALVKAAQLSMQHQRSLVHTDGLENASEHDAIISLPVSIGGEPLLSIALHYRNADPGYAQQISTFLQEGLASLNDAILSIRARDAKTSGDGREQPDPETQENHLETLTQLLATALAQENFKALATVLTTKMATLMKCDRVSLGYRKHNQCQLAAISNNADHKPQQALVEAMTAAMDEAIDQKMTVEFPPPANTQGRIYLLHRQLAERHQGGAIVTIPLFSNNEAVGALLLERPKNRPFRQHEIELLEDFGSFLSPVVKMQHELGLGWWQRGWSGLRQGVSRVFGRGQLLFKIVPLTLMLVIAAGLLITVPFQIKAPARVEGAIQRVISAPADGYIQSVHVRPGDQIEKGQLLLALEDDDLKLERRKLEGEIAQLKSEYGTALAGSDRGKLAVVMAQIEEAKARQALIDQQLERVRLIAPFDAIVIDGDLTQALGSPVKAGDKLLTLAPQNDYRVIVNVDERDIRFVAPKQHGRLTLAASPQDQFEIELRQITPMAQVVDGHNVFPAEAGIVSGPQELLRPGMKGVSKIDAGERPVFWVWMRRSIDWLKFQRWIWMG